MSPPRSLFKLRRTVGTGWRTHVVLLMLLVSFTLFAGQQKGHPSSWRGLPLRRGRSSWMVRVGVNAGVCGELNSRKHLMTARGVAYVSSIYDGA